MKLLSGLILIELYKSVKSKLVWITFGAFTLLPIMGGFFMVVLKDPAKAEQWGLLGDKAQLVGSADWPSLLDMLAQGISIGGLFVFGFITSWIFGREYTDRTIKDLLALPFPRMYIPISKFVAVLILSFVATAWIITVGFLLGHAIQLPGWSAGVWQHGLQVMITASMLTIMLSTPVAWMACYGRGYLASLGFVIVTMILSQIIAAIGYGSYFPWAIPAIYSNVGGEGNVLPAASLLIILVTSLLGIVSTLHYWRYADHGID